MKYSRIAVLGGSGPTGRHFIEKALAEGHEVQLLVRKPEKVDIEHGKLTLIKGSIMDTAAVERVVQGSNAVVTMIGRAKGSPENFMTQGISNILEAMKKYNVNRIISLTGSGVPAEDDEPKLTDKAIAFASKKLLGKEVRFTLKDARQHAEILKASDAKWTIIRAPMLINSPGKGTLKVDHIGGNVGYKISRADLADFILNELEEENYVEEMPFVSN
jgi:putative NADH-flavin reductase